MSKKMALLAPVLFLAGCFEQPVRETLTIRFRADGGVGIVTERRIAPDDRFDRNEAMKARLEAERRAAWRFEDAWATRLRRLRAKTERVTFESRAGTLETVRWETLLEERAALAELFRGDPLDAFLVEEEGVVTYEIYPGRGSRATPSEARRVERAFDELVDAFAREMAATADLYAYFVANPERRRLLLGAILEVEGEEPEEADRVPAVEVELVERTIAAIDAVTKVLVVPGEEDASLEELSRRAFDPFPAALVIEVPGELVELAGFVESEPGKLAVPERSLWRGFERLEGRFVSPDLARANVDRSLKGDDFDFEAFLARESEVFGRPSPDEVEEALRDELRSEPVYRVRFRVDAGTTEPGSV